MKLTKFLEKSIIAGLATAHIEVQSWLDRHDAVEHSYLGCLILLSLYFENNSDQIGPARMAKYFGYSRARVSQVLTNLENKGLILRTLSSKSARNTLIRLTAQGEKRAGDLVKTFSRLQSLIDEKIGESQAEIITKKLNELSFYLQSKS